MNPEVFQRLPAAPYPAPPPFWKHFTTDNVERMNHAEPDSKLTIGLNFLRPPPPPASDAELYTTFSIPLKLDPTPDLPPPEILLFDPRSRTFNHARALKQLTNSLLLNFLDLITVLSNDPVKYEEKMQDIERLMLNVHFVINLYRPHQAREGVKEMLQTQLDRGRQEIAKCDDMRHKVETFLKEIETQNATVEVNDKASSSKSTNEDTGRLWNIIRSLKNDD